MVTPILGAVHRDPTTAVMGDKAAARTRRAVVAPSSASSNGASSSQSFEALLESTIHLIKMWRHEYNTFRPHSVLGDRPPASAAAEPRTALRVGSKRVRRPGESHWGDNDTGCSRGRETTGGRHLCVMLTD
ncbi:MAG: transposase [Gemmatimonadetes bacterium]|nr:transposase [Gemmatimonadota bacterium]